MVARPVAAQRALSRFCLAGAGPGVPRIRYVGVDDSSNEPAEGGSSCADSRTAIGTPHVCTSRASADGPAAFRNAFIRIGRTGAAGSDRVAPTRRQQSYDAALYASVPYSAHNSENRRSPDRGGSGRRCAFRGRVSSMTSGISLTPSPCSASMSQAKCDPLCQKLAVQPLYQGAEGAITPLTLWQPRRARASPRSEEVRFAMDSPLEEARIRTLGPARDGR